jgi:sulfur transfer complex TusBCD TusB component (DsrH family)
MEGVLQPVEIVVVDANSSAAGVTAAMTTMLQQGINIYLGAYSTELLLAQMAVVSHLPTPPLIVSSAASKCFALLTDIRYRGWEPKLS